MSIQEKVSAVMAEIKKIPHDSENRWAGYRYASADAVYLALRPIMAKHGLAVRHTCSEPVPLSHRDAEFLILPVSVGWEGDEYTAHHYVPLNTAGKKGVTLSAQDMQAAITYAVKYFLRTRLLLDTGEPDADDSVRQDVVPNPEPAAFPRLQGKTIAMSDGSGVAETVQAGGRKAAAALFTFVKSIIATNDERDEIVAINLPLIKACIPAAGWLALAGEMERAGMAADLIAEFKSNDQAQG